MNVIVEGGVAWIMTPHAPRKPLPYPLESLLISYDPEDTP
jgi:hypothetical protein